MQAHPFRSAAEPPPPPVGPGWRDTDTSYNPVVIGPEIKVSDGGVIGSRIGDDGRRRKIKRPRLLA